MPRHVTELQVNFWSKLGNNGVVIRKILKRFQVIFDVEFELNAQPVDFVFNAF
jgi:hypothetical protein